MRRPDIGDIQYCIFDPTGNITALVETAVDPAFQPALASRIMELHPEVEQVGFVTFAGGEAEQSQEQSGSASDSSVQISLRMTGGDAQSQEQNDVPADTDVQISLRMAGGEFCGNATMCAAALYAIRSGLQDGAVAVKVSGASAPLTVSLERQAAGAFSAAVEMPPALKIGMMEPAPEDVGASGVSAKLSLPVVELEGISHIIIEPDSGFFGIKEDSAAAETLLRQWCSALGSDCLGMMFLGGADDIALGAASSASEPGGAAAAADARIACERALIPLVYVPGADTMFWENSCASGSAAAGMYLAAKAGKPVDITFDEPAGQLRVESDPLSGKTVLHGYVILRNSEII